MTYSNPGNSPVVSTNVAAGGKLQVDQDQIKQRNTLTDERLNPCVKEQSLSFKCLNENDYDRERCKPFFDNYNTCKAFWNHVSKDRRSKGLKPALPWPLSERESIKREYMAKLNI